jgi:hypothetical protein
MLPLLRKQKKPRREAVRGSSPGPFVSIARLNGHIAVAAKGWHGGRFVDAVEERRQGIHHRVGTGHVALDGPFAHVVKVPHVLVGAATGGQFVVAHDFLGLLQQQRQAAQLHEVGVVRPGLRHVAEGRQQGRVAVEQAVKGRLHEGQALLCHGLDGLALRLGEVDGDEAVHGVDDGVEGGLEAGQLWGREAYTHRGWYRHNVACFW